MIYLLFLIATIIRFYRLDAASFWYDEAFTGLLMRLDLPGLLAATAGDTHPPLYYLIAWLFTRVTGVSELSLRAFSAVLSVASLAVFWRLSADYLSDRRARLVAMVLMVFMPSQLWFAQEARMYSMLTLEFLLAVWFTHRRRWLPLGLCVSALIFTHNYGLFYAAGLALAAAANEIRRPVHLADIDPYPRNPKWSPGDQAHLRNLVMAFILPGFAWLVTWGVVLVGQMREINNSYWIMPVTPGAVLYAMQMLYLAHATPENIQVVNIMLTYALSLWAIYAGLQTKKRELLFLSMFPVIAALGVSLVWQPVLLYRGILPVAPLLYLLIANAISTNVRTLLFGAILLTPIILGGVIGYYLLVPENKGEGVRVVRDIILADWQPGDAILHTNDGSAVNLAWQLPDLPQYTLPVNPECGNDPGALSDRTRQAIGLDSRHTNQVNAERVWLVYAVGPLSTNCEANLADEIRRGSTEIKLIEESNLKSFGVYRYAQP